MKLSRIITWRPSDFPWWAFDRSLAGFWPTPGGLLSGGLLSDTRPNPPESALEWLGVDVMCVCRAEQHLYRLPTLCI